MQRFVAAVVLILINASTCFGSYKVFYLGSQITSGATTITADAYIQTQRLSYQFTITAGGGGVTLNAVPTVAPTSTQWTVTAQWTGSHTLSSPNSISFNVTFLPTSAGTDNVAVSFPTNSAPATFSISFDGTGHALLCPTGCSPVATCTNSTCFPCSGSCGLTFTHAIDFHVS